MQEQIFGQLVAVLKEKANLSEEQAGNVANVVAEWAQANAGDLVKMAMEKGLAGGEGGLLGGLGNLFGGRS